MFESLFLIFVLFVCLLGLVEAIEKEGR